MDIVYLLLTILGIIIAIIFGYLDELVKNIFKDCHFDEVPFLINLFNREDLKIQMERNGCFTFTI